jgi:hypothetical protein
MKIIVKQCLHFLNHSQNKGRAMTADNQALLSAIRQIVSESVSEAIVPLAGRIDALTERVDALTERSPQDSRGSRQGGLPRD